MTDDNYNEEAINTLLSIVQEGDYILWLGSGLSKASGYKMWKDAVNFIAKHCGVEEFSQDEDPTIEELLSKAEDCKNLRENRYKDAIFETFSKIQLINDFSLTLLAQLPFKAIVTTNFDPIIKTIFPGNVHYYPLLPSIYLNSKPMPVYYLHGIADIDKSKNQNPQDLHYVLSTSEFDFAYSTKRTSLGEGESAEFLRQLLSHHSLLFVGAGLEELAFKSLFERIDTFVEDYARIGHIREDNSLKRYALLPRTPIKTREYNDEDLINEIHKKEEERDIRFNKYRIRKILYQKSEGPDEFENLTQIIRKTLQRLQSPEFRKNGNE